MDRSKYLDTAVLISQSNLIVYSDGSLEELNFSNFSKLELNRESLLKFIPFIYVIIVLAIIFIYLFIYLFSIAAYFLTALIYSLIGLVIKSVIHANVNYRTLFCIAVYSKVTMIIITALVSAFEKSIPFKWLFSLGVSCIYMTMALKEFKLNNPPDINGSSEYYLDKGQNSNTNDEFYR